VEGVLLEICQSLDLESSPTVTMTLDARGRSRMIIERESTLGLAA
jgi:hypothetical protein